LLLHQNSTQDRRRIDRNVLSKCWNTEFVIVLGHLYSRNIPIEDSHYV